MIPTRITMLEDAVGALDDDDDGRTKKRETSVGWPVEIYRSLPAEQRNDRS